MEAVNESINNLQSIINDVTEYMKTTSDEDLVLSKVKSKLKNFLKYDFYWIDSIYYNNIDYKIKKQLTDGFIQFMEKIQRIVVNEKSNGIGIKLNSVVIIGM